MIQQNFYISIKHSCKERKKKRCQDKTFIYNLYDKHAVQTNDNQKLSVKIDLQKANATERNWYKIV